MKICNFCKRILDLSNYCANKSKKDGLSTYCRDCKKEYNKLYYASFSEKQKERAKNWKRKRLEEIDLYLNSIKIKCIYCNENDSCCLDFHHKNPKEKDDSISSLRNKTVSLDRIKKELEKCEVVCANCHKKIHAGCKL